MRRDTSIPLTVVIPIKDRNGSVVGEKEVASYAGLLAKAHDEGLTRVETTLVQIPSPENKDTAIVTAIVETKKGRFTGIGDANPGNVNRRIAPHLTRMAETRAVSRALRLAVNIGLVSVDELGELDGEALTEGEARTAARQEAIAEAEPARRPEAPADRSVMHRTTASAGRSAERGSSIVPRDNGVRVLGMTDSQRKYLFRLCADLGIEGDATREHLLDALGVRDLRDATKSGASALIDKLRAEVEDKKAAPANGSGGASDEIPF